MNEPDINFTDFLLKYINPKREGFFIEAGANTGYAGSVCYWLEHKYRWSGMNIEPNPFCFEELQKTRPKSINLNYGLYHSAGELVFTMPINGPRKYFAGQGSVVFKPNHWGKRPTKSFPVKVERLDTLLKVHNISKIDLMVLDVEGSELDAIQGFGEKALPVFLCIEDDKVNKKSLDSLLSDLNYTYINKYKNNSLYTQIKK